MADQDSFINEVTEEVRRDRLFALFRRYGWIAILTVLVLVGGAAWNEWRKASARADAEARGTAMLEALEAASPQDGLERLAALSAEDAPDMAAVLALARAGLAQQVGETETARQSLEAAATTPGASAIYRDLATLKDVMNAGDALSPGERIERLQPLALPGAPFALIASEQIALAEIARGDDEAAIAQLTRIVEDQAAGQAMQQRALQLIVALGGDVPN